MRSTNSTSETGISLCLSGGGLRATLFHLGVVRFLSEAGLLSNVRHIYAVSGGSILAAHLVLHWERYVKPIDTFRDAAWDVLRFAQINVRDRILRRPYSSPIDLLQVYYKDWLFFDKKRPAGKQLKDLRAHGKPLLSLLTTNLTTGTLGAFTAEGFCSDVSKGSAASVACGDVPIALAVAASSAFPALFPPVRVTPERLRVQFEELKHHRLFLTDGGVYDNLGIQALPSSKRGDASSNRVLVSDATLEMDWSDSGTTVRPVSVLKTALRAFDIATHEIHKRDSARLQKSRVTVIKIGTVVSNGTYRRVLDLDVQRYLKFIRTDLNRFSNAEITALVQHGYETARHQLVEENLLGDEGTPKDCLWTPFPTSSAEEPLALDPDALYEGRHRRLSALVLAPLLTVLLVAFLSVVAVWLVTQENDTAVRPKTVQVIGETWGVASLQEYPALVPHADALLAEGAARTLARGVGGRTAGVQDDTNRDARLVLWRLGPFPSPAPPMRVTVPRSDTTEIAVTGMHVRRVEDKTWSRAFELGMEFPPKVDLPSIQPEDRLLLLVLEIDVPDRWAQHEWGTTWKTEDVR